MRHFDTKALEFDVLLRQISQYCHCETSALNVLQIQPFQIQSDAQRQLDIIADIMGLANISKKLPLRAFTDISSLCKRLKPEGAIVEASEVASVLKTLEVISNVSAFVHEASLVAPHLYSFASSLTGFERLEDVIKSSIDLEGNILDTASEQLAFLRSQIKATETKIKQRLQDIVRDNTVRVFLQDDFITERSGRWVIPVRMDSKGQVPGVVHDVSHSGETAFVEPLAIIKLSNELENLVAEAKAEEIRILKKICHAIRLQLDELLRQFELLTEVDALNAIAEFSRLMQMNIPTFCDSPQIELIAARHPILQLSYQSITPARTVVPLDIALKDQETVMVITGSNAGGKTVALKTIGLAVLSAISGIPICASKDSQIPFVNSILVDIGDEQSLQSHLSTFSAHVAKLAHIVNTANSNSLVLIDELGTGTDPEEGSALSCALLSELLSRRCLVFCTTHLSSIKAFAYETKGMSVASMLFDTETFSPLYKLIVGYTGSSHALDIALRYGMDKRIISLAKSFLHKSRTDFDNLIFELQSKKQDYEQKLAEFNLKELEVKQKLKTLDDTLQDASNKAKQILAKAYEEANSILTDIKRQFASTLVELKKLDKQSLKEALKKASSLQDDISQRLTKLKSDETDKLSIHDIATGDTLYVCSAKANATVLGINFKTNRVRLRLGSIEIEVGLEDLKRPQGSIQTKEDIGYTMQSAHNDGIQTLQTLNIIGQRVDPALSEVERFINQAVLEGLQEVKIIHGIGTGTLKKAVREYLSEHPSVQSLRDAQANEGAGAVTVVTLK